MITQLTRNRWLLAWRGMIPVLLGLAILVRLDISLAAMGLLFGAFALADGLLALIVSQLDRYQSDRGWELLLKGPASIAIGVLTLFWPSITAQALVALIAAWAILTGAFAVVAALEVRNLVEGARQSAWDNLIEREMMRVR
jgi:uncharacterized membrane protein HdeD (DUF308 family)